MVKYTIKSSGNWLDDFYRYAESNIRNYKRPKDWETRINKLTRKNPVRNQKEGCTKYIKED